MKIIVSLLFISLFSILNIAAQEKVWLDVNENITTKEKALYYRVSSNDNSKNQLVIDYYISGKKAKEAYFVNGKKEGKYVAFYPTSEVKTTGRFKDGLKEGIWKVYSKSGKIKEKGKYVKGEKVGVWKTFYKNN